LNDLIINLTTSSNVAYSEASDHSYSHIYGLLLCVYRISDRKENKQSLGFGSKIRKIN